jgi:hypothetical protein
MRAKTSLDDVNLPARTMTVYSIHRAKLAHLVTGMVQSSSRFATGIAARPADLEQRPLALVSHSAR